MGIEHDVQRQLSDLEIITDLSSKGKNLERPDNHEWLKKAQDYILESNPQDAICEVNMVTRKPLVRYIKRGGQA